MQEIDWRDTDRVAPLLYANRFGFLNIMKRADAVVEFREEWAFRWFMRMIYIGHPAAEYMASDPKSCNYGWINGKLVKVDYA